MDGEVSPDEVERIHDDPDVTVVDIRSPAAYDRGHVPGSLNLPFDRLPDEVERLEGNERIVTVCPHGQASVGAARLIASYEGTAEARIESMAGGLEAWEGPLEREDGNQQGDASDPPF